MPDQTIIIVDDGRSARASVAHMASILRNALPEASTLDVVDGERHEAVRVVTAQWAVLRDYQERHVPLGRRRSILTATRWVELSAEYGTDGVFAFDGCPVYLDQVQGEDDHLPVPHSLIADIQAWNREFEQQIKVGDGSSDPGSWIVEHDARGRELARQLRRILRCPWRWMVRFLPLGNAEEGATDQPTPAARPSLTAMQTPVPLAADGWRFGIAPSDAPRLVGAFDRNTMSAAMASHREVLVRWEALHSAELASASDGHWEGRDVLRQHLLAQQAAILAWSEPEHFRAGREQRHGLPVNEVQAARRVGVMADYSSGGLWDWEGCAVDPDDLPISGATKRRLAAWIALYEREKGWDTIDRRPFTLDRTVFDRWGLAIARAIKHELPDWQVGFRGEEVEVPDVGLLPVTR